MVLLQLLLQSIIQIGVRLEKVPEVALSELEALAQAHPDDNDLAAVLACANLAVNFFPIRSYTVRRGCFPNPQSKDYCLEVRCHLAS